MPANSKTKRQRPADHVPGYILKDANQPRDNSDVVCEGAELNVYMDTLEQDERLNFDLDDGSAKAE